MKPRWLESEWWSDTGATDGEKQECNKALWRVLVMGATSSCFEKMALAPVENRL